eukprot:Filipodium_phascolosomae@DN7094_c0_g1_i1.p1
MTPADIVVSRTVEVVEAGVGSGNISSEGKVGRKSKKRRPVCPPARRIAKTSAPKGKNTNVKGFENEGAIVTKHEAPTREVVEFSASERRSSTRRRMPPLDWWASERFVYERQPGADIPEVVGVLTCTDNLAGVAQGVIPTEANVRKRPKNRKSKPSNNSGGDEPLPLTHPDSVQPQESVIPENNAAPSTAQQTGLSETRKKPGRKSNKAASAKPHHTRVSTSQSQIEKESEEASTKKTKSQKLALPGNQTGQIVPADSPHIANEYKDSPSADKRERQMMMNWSNLEFFSVDQSGLQVAVGMDVPTLVSFVFSVPPKGEQPAEVTDRVKIIVVLTSEVDCVNVFLGDGRATLSSGDSLCVPQGASFGMRNKSQAVECRILVVMFHTTE